MPWVTEVTMSLEDAQLFEYVKDVVTGDDAGIMITNRPGGLVVKYYTWEHDIEYFIGFEKLLTETIEDHGDEPIGKLFKELLKCYSAWVAANTSS